MNFPKPNLKLKARIVERYGSQSNFAYATNTDEAIISKIIRGRRKPTDEQCAIWASLLGTEPDRLFDERRA
jgi:hypothetical protein